MEFAQLVLDSQRKGEERGANEKSKTKQNKKATATSLIASDDEREKNFHDVELESALAGELD